MRCEFDSRYPHHRLPSTKALNYYKYMHVPKNYFHDKTVIGLLILNAAMLMIGVLSVILRIDPAEGETFTVQYRASLGNLAFKSGPLTEIRLFIPFFMLVTISSVVLSMRVYGHRRHVATMLLGIVPFLVLLGIVISDRLIVHS